MLAPVNARSIPDLADGQAEAIINAAIKQAVTDLDDRGHEDKKARQVQILLTFDIGDTGDVFVVCEAAPKMPARRTKATSSKLYILENGPSLQFNTIASNEPTQRTIDELHRPDDGRDA